MTEGEIHLPEKNNTNSTRIFLARHGQTEWNRSGRFQGRSDVPLNDEGKEQVRALGLALKSTPFTAIYTSPLSRAMETAERIGAWYPEIPIIKEEGFVEMELADFDGMEARKWMSDHADFAKAWRDNPGCVRMPGPGGECLEDVQARALTALERISQSHPAGSTLLICSHNFVILSILCKAKGISLDKFRELKQDTAAFSVIRLQGKQYSVEIMNERSHL
ncbi:MAG: histidine phosphatase family protein [Desulfobacteraceae bacterium]|nr:histidine phosphatase family protein [Desulfobacteraceae bacterium]